MAGFCRKCGSPLGEGAMFCKKCGTQVVSIQKIQPIQKHVQQQKNQCRKCGNPLNEGAMFCRKCGMRVEMNNADASKVQPTISTQPNAQRNGSSNIRPSHSGWLAPIAVFLAIVILGNSILIHYAELKYPRLNPRMESNVAKSVDSGLDSGRSDNKFNKGLGVGNDEGEAMPQSALQIMYTENEIKSASRKESSITKDNPTVIVGDVSVALPYFLIDENESVTVAELPARSDSEGNEIYAYDISLKSGMHQLGACAEITIPRKAKPGEIGSVVYFNEATGKWDTVCYDISDDGKSYIIQTTHFSIFGESLKKVGDIYGSTEENLAGEMFYKVYNEGKGLHQERVEIDENKLMDMVKNSVNAEEVASIKYDPSSQTTIPEDTTLTWFLNTICNRFGIGYGATVLNQLGGFIDNLGFTKGCGYAGATLTFLRMGYQYVNGGKFSEVVWDNRGDILGTVTSFFAINAAAVTATSAASAFGWAGLIIFLGVELQNAYNEAEKDYSEFLPQDIYEAVAAYYNNKNASYRGYSLSFGELDNLISKKNDYGSLFKDPFSICKPLADITNENPNNPAKIYEEIDALLDAYSAPFFALSADEQYAYVQRLYNVENEKKAFLDSAFVYNVIKDKSEEEYLSYYNFGIEQTQMADHMKRWEYTYRERTRNWAVRNSRDVIQSYIKGYYARSIEELKKALRNETLPLMNRTVLLNAVDQTTDKSVKTFDQSPYGKNTAFYEDVSQITGTELFSNFTPYSLTFMTMIGFNKEGMPMYFEDISNPALYYPSNKEALCKYYGIRDYYHESTFVPHSNIGTDEIFCCKFYDYVAVGMPKTIIFNGDEVNPPVRCELQMDAITDNSAMITGTAIVKSNEPGGFITIDSLEDATGYSSEGMSFSTLKECGITPEVDFTLDNKGNWTLAVKEMQCYSNGVVYEIKGWDVRGTASAETLSDDAAWGENGIDEKQRLRSAVTSMKDLVLTRDIYSSEGQNYIRDHTGTCDISSSKTYLSAVPDFSIKDRTKIDFTLNLDVPSVMITRCKENGEVEANYESPDSGRMTYVSFSVELDMPLSQFRWLSGK